MKKSPTRPLTCSNSPEGNAVADSESSAALQLGIRILAVAKVVKTFGDSRDRPKLLTSFATLKRMSHS